MSENLEKQIAELEEAISVQEGLRATIGDSIVNATIATLKEKLADLQQSVSEERKLVTCLFCDVVGSTKLAADRDPEEVLNIVDGALQEMRFSIEHFGGHVARYMGDGVLSTFGAPRALERHSQQAILAGLEIQRRIGQYANFVAEEYSIPDFKVRVGINSGYVVAGKIAGNQGEYTVIGDMVNLAARIEEMAPPGGVLIGETTYKLANEDLFFEVRDHDPILVKGSNEPLRVFEISGVKVRSTPGHIRIGTRAPMTGRDSELSKLQGCFAEVRENSILRACVVVGAAGIGKSRLKQEFTQWLQQEQPSTTVWAGRALSYEAYSPYRLIADLLRRVVGINDADNVEVRREKLLDLKGVFPELSDEHLHGLAAILAIDFAEDSLRQLEPQAKRNAIFNAFSTLCELQAQQGQLVLVLEDTHWGDELSLELLEYVFNTLPDSPIQILMMTRPVTDYNPKALDIRARIDQDRYAELRLLDLTPDQTEIMVQGLLGSERVPEDFLSTIVTKTQGNPFFIEEIVNALIERGAVQRSNGRWVVTDQAVDVQVPDTVQGVLAARIDQLDPALKQIVQHAAIIGRTFWQQLLADLMGQNLDTSLALLNEHEFIEQHGAAGFVEDDVEWIFRHVLLQEVAYDSVLKEVRRDVHRQIAEWLERRAPDRLEELAPTLARHYERGEVIDRAIEYLAMAAARSKALFSPRDAVQFYDRAIDLVERNEAIVVPQKRFDLFENRGEALGLAGEWRAALSDLTRVLENAQKEGDRGKEHNLLVSLGMVYRRADDYDKAMSNLNHALEVARETDDKSGIADVLYHLGSVAWSEGDNVQSASYHSEAVEIVNVLKSEDLAAVQAFHGRGEAYWFSGYPGRAIEFLTKSLDLARVIGDLSYESENLQMIGFMHQAELGIAQPGKVIKFAEESLEISQKNHMDWHTIPALLTLASPYATRGEYDRALRLLEEANGQAERIGSLRMLSIGLDYLGSIYQDLDLFEQAEEIHAQSVRVALEIGSKFWLPRSAANLYIDRLRLGDLGVEDELRKTLEETKDRDQIAHGIRSIEGLAEVSVAKGDSQMAKEHANELESIASSGEMRFLLAQAHRWRGEAYLLEGKCEQAELQFIKAVELNREIDSPRLSIDLYDALARLLLLTGDEMGAERHEKSKRQLVLRIAREIEAPELSGAFAGIIQSDTAKHPRRSG